MLDRQKLPTKIIRKGYFLPSQVNRTHEGRLLTPLMYASWKGHQEVAQELLTMGADINGSVIAPGIHRTPLSAALEGCVQLTLYEDGDDEDDGLLWMVVMGQCVRCILL